MKHRAVTSWAEGKESEGNSVEGGKDLGGFGQAGF